MPAEGYRFVGWTENGGTASTSASYTFTVNANRTLTAVFEKAPVITPSYIITTAASPSAGGTVTGDGQYLVGTEVTVTAAPDKEYVFKSWTENGSTVSTNASYTFTVSASRSLTAVFETKGATAPTITTWPTASAINYGQKLSDSKLSGGKASVNGTFRWVNPSAVAKAGQSIVFGNEKGLFSPNDPITREQLAVIFWRYTGSPAYSGGTLDFTDTGRISSYAKDAVGWAAANGIISGKGGGVLDPQGPATRAQVAQMLKNYLDK